MKISPADIEAWLDAFARAVRDRDYQAGRTMFAEDVASFGTIGRTLVGLEALVAGQWTSIWANTRGFTFAAPVFSTATGDIAVVAAEWHSDGVLGEATYPRAGRATLVLKQGPDGLICVHSHFSMAPGTPALAGEGKTDGA